VVYNAENYWVVGLCPSSGIKLENNVSESGSVSVFR
jgi:hypothetical protein